MLSLKIIYFINFYLWLLFILSIGSWEEIDNRMLVMENRNIPPNIKGN